MKPAFDRSRRMQPWLGTFVEIEVSLRDEAMLQGAFDIFFRVQNLMSFYNRTSDVSRMNQEAFQHPVQVDRWTWEVLSASLEISKRSAGLFDVTAGGSHCDWREIELLHENRVRLNHPKIRVNLGGIAKGFAVDQAIEFLRRHGANEALVNAGGDLRCFGDSVRKVWIRNAISGEAGNREFRLGNSALATSAGLFRDKAEYVFGRSPFLSPTHNSPIFPIQSVSVKASTAIIADALTKVALTGGWDCMNFDDSWEAALI